MGSQFRIPRDGYRGAVLICIALCSAWSALSVRRPCLVPCGSLVPWTWRLCESGGYRHTQDRDERPLVT